MFRVTVAIKPSIESIEEALRRELNKINKNDGRLFTLLRDLGYNRNEIAQYYKVKPVTVSQRVSSFKRESPEYSTKSPTYKIWKQTVFEKCVKEHINKKEFYKLNIQEVYV